MDGVGVTASSISNVCVLCDWHISGDVGRRSVTGSVARVAENLALGRRSQVRGSVVGPFSHVAILLSCVASSEFKQLVPAHKAYI